MASLVIRAFFVTEYGVPANKKQCHEMFEISV